MKKLQIRIVLFAALTLLFSSCLNDEEEEVTYYGDAAITTFVLGTLNRTVHTTTSSGADSTYTTTVSGSSYKCYIDQVNRVIYNADSLPTGTDISHVLVTITAKNGGTITIKNIDSDTLTYYSSTDSIDFSVPRTIAVYAYTGNATVHTDYTVRLNVHQKESDKFAWTAKGTYSAFENTQGMKAYALGGRLYVFAATGGQTMLYAADEAETSWQQLTPDFNLTVPAADYQNTGVSGGYLYLFTGGNLLRSQNGSQWQLVSKPAIARLLGGSSYALYGTDSEGRLMASYDGGTTWKEEATETSWQLLPTRDISVAVLPSTTNPGVENVVITGNRSLELYPDESNAVVWTKVSEQNPNAPTNTWMYADATDFPTYQLPRLANLCTATSGKGLLAVGGKGLGTCTETDFQHFHYSYNGGMHWVTNVPYEWPTGFSCDSGSFAMTTDEQGRLWLVCGGSGQVWCGEMSQYDLDEQSLWITE